MRSMPLALAIGMALLVVAVALVSGSGPVRRWREGDGFAPKEEEEAFVSRRTRRKTPEPTTPTKTPETTTPAIPKPTLFVRPRQPAVRKTDLLKQHPPKQITLWDVSLGMIIDNIYGKQEPKYVYSDNPFPDWSSDVCAGCYYDTEGGSEGKNKGKSRSYEDCNDFLLRKIDPNSRSTSVLRDRLSKYMNTGSEGAEPSIVTTDNLYSRIAYTDNMLIITDESGQYNMTGA